MRMYVAGCYACLAVNGRVLLPEGNGWMKQIEENNMVKPTGIQNYVSKSLLWHGC